MVGLHPAEQDRAGRSGGGPLTGRTVALLEARRSAELARLVENLGGVPYVAPILREIPVDDERPLLAWLDRLAAGDFAATLFLTGVGCRALLDLAARAGRQQAVRAGLAATRVVARGPKPVRVLREHGVRIDLVPPTPGTSDELLAALADWPLTGTTVGLQLYGGSTPFLARLQAGLAARSVQVAAAQPYRWEGPADETPIRALIDACLAGQIDALAILSSSQIHNLFAIAEAHDQDAALRAALNDSRVLVAAIGPVAAEAIVSHGVGVDLQPEQSRMGHLVAALGPALAARGT